MQQVPADIWAAFERRLDQGQVPADQRPDYHKWVRFYCDFCHKYGHSPAAPTSLGPFMSARLPSHAPGLLLSFLRGQQNNAISLTDPFTTDSVAKQSTGNHASIILTDMDRELLFGAARSRRAWLLGAFMLTCVYLLFPAGLLYCTTARKYWP